MSGDGSEIQGDATAGAVTGRRRTRVRDAAARRRRWPAPHAIRFTILGHVVNAGAAGATAPEIAAALAGDGNRHPTNQRHHLVAGRLVELATIGLVKAAGVDRGGWKVWVAATAGTPNGQGEKAGRADG